MTPKNPRGCAGYWTDTIDGREFDCDYDTVLDCEACRYSGLGRKDPEAYCNSGTKERKDWASTLKAIRGGTT